MAAYKDKVRTVVKKKSEKKEEMALKAQTRHPFQSPKEYEDSVTLKFDDKRKLYASAAFLRRISTVFDVMLSSNFKEKSTGVVELKNRRLEDCLAFLHLCHDTEYKPLTESNALGVVEMAEQYQIPMAIEVCKFVISSMLQKISRENYFHNPKFDNGRYFSDKHVALKSLLEIFYTVSVYNYTSLITQTCEMLAEFPSCMYIENKKCNHEMHSHTCIDGFKILPFEAKAMLLEARLSKPCNE